MKSEKEIQKEKEVKELEQVEKMFTIANYIFREEKSTIVSIGTKHIQSAELTVLLCGRVEFNSFKHRRDAWDVAVKFDIYFKRNEDGTYEAGTHDLKDKEVSIAISPTEAVSEMAYILIKRKIKGQ